MNTSYDSPPEILTSPIRNAMLDCKGETQIAYQERFPNQSAHPLSDFYEFNHMVIKKSESRTDSLKVIRFCIRVTCCTFLTGKGIKRHDTGILINVFKKD